MWKRFTGIASVVVALFLVTAACSSAPTNVVAAFDNSAAEEANNEETSSDVDRVLEVELTEFDIAADSFAFTPGETVEFVITNSGVVEHEFRLSNADRVEEHLDGDHTDHDDAMTDNEMAEMPDDDHDDDEADHEDEEGDHADEAADAVLVLAAGESGTLVFTFPDNDHDYTAAVCLLPGHHEAGMATDLTY